MIFRKQGPDRLSERAPHAHMQKRPAGSSAAPSGSRRENFVKRALYVGGVAKGTEADNTPRLGSQMNQDQQKPKSKRGFAAMSPERRREIASKGGKSVPAEKRSFSQNTDLAAAAGHKGGKAVDPAKRAFARDRELASQAGSKSGGGWPKQS